MPLDLSVVIPTYNEEKHINNCLQAIGKDFASSIYVVDSNSSDNTVKIAEKFGVNVINFKWDGKFPKKRNWFLINYEIKTKWILFLDADELLTQEFKNEISDTLPITNHKGFYLNYSNYFLNERLKGGLTMRKLALFMVGNGMYEKIDEDYWSNLDMEVHEHPIINGSLGSIKSKIDHKDFNGLKRYIAKHNQYSSWEAHRYIKNKSEGGTKNFWTLRQKIKYRFVSNPFFGIALFFYQIFILGAWKDGKIGLYFALLKSSYFIQVSSKIYELENKLEFMKK